MKPPFLLLSFAASFAALAAFAASPALAVSPMLITGVLLLLNADYGRNPHPLTAPVSAGRGAERLPLAA
jgi:hypothetical protein